MLSVPGVWCGAVQGGNGLGLVKGEECQRVHKENSSVCDSVDPKFPSICNVGCMVKV